MSTEPQHSAASLVNRIPSASGQEVLSTLKPPPHFDSATFDSYVPDPRYPSQEEAQKLLRAFIDPPKQLQQKSSFFGFSKKKKAGPQEQPDSPSAGGKPGIYLDGGFGVGKTHLLAAAWHAANGRKYFGSFLEYTSLVGALGFQQTIDALRGAKLICIDEFELDDPGDTMMMTRLIKELVQTGTRFIATSNTPPNALGEGRFAAQDFLREIQAMADQFYTMRIDGEDYRQRNLQGNAITLSDEEYSFVIANSIMSGDRVTDDDFEALIDHLATIHPSVFTKLISNVHLIGIRNVQELHDQTQALRFVALVDRVYDAQIPVRATGVPLNTIFAGGMLDGGYRKKYLRCMSRLIALTSNQY